jgi:hypothetical protein
VPEKITLSASITNPNGEIVFLGDLGSESASSHDERSRIELGNIFELTAESSQGLKTWPALDAGSGARRSPPVIVKVPELNGKANGLMIFTEITVFDDVVIREYESSLTYPVLDHSLGSIEAGMQLEFCYVTGEQPGLRYRIL